MKKSNNTGVLVINYLASCGKEDVDTLDLLKAVAPGCHNEEDMDKAFGNILPVLTSLESGGLVKLSTEAIPSTGFVPKVIHILPKMRKTAARLMQDKATPGQAGRTQPEEKDAAQSGAKKGTGRKRRQDDIDERYRRFVDLFEKKRKQARVRGEWNRLIASIVYHDIEEEIGFKACVNSFVNGLIFQKRLENIGPVKEAAGKPEKDEPAIRPELLKLIDDIVRSDEEKNGALKEGRQRRRPAREADATLVRLDREEIRDFMHCLHNMRDGVQPGNLWRDAVSRFMGELLQNLPIYEACMESFRAGIVWQMNRKALEPGD